MTLHNMHCERSGQREMPGKKQHVSTGQRNPQGLKKMEMESQESKSTNEAMVQETKGGFMKVNTAKCYRFVALVRVFSRHGS